jgi:protein phosphatase 1L
LGLFRLETRHTCREGIMTLAAACSRFVRRYIFSPEAVILCILVLLVYNSVFHVKPLLRYIQRAKDKFQLRWGNGASGRRPADRSARAGVDKDSLFRDKSKASWELKKDNVAIYAIQGRRPHMEDRFNVVNDLEHTRTSLYGVFDGHGGEVLMQSTISINPKRTLN